MKKLSFISLLLFLLFVTFSFCTLAQEDKIMKLPEPRMSGGIPLLDALKLRESSRSYSSAGLSEQQLSDLLWAGFGISRPERGLRTAPSARNFQDIDIYVVMADGWYLYDHKGHALVRKGTNDIREQTGMQDFVKIAPVNLVFVSDFTKMGDRLDDDTKSFYASNHAGYISQNIYLFCASEGLATVVRGAINRDKIREALKLQDHQHVIFAQTVGLPEK